MLVRYVGGTLLILGGAMLFAPKAPEGVTPATEVARSAAPAAVPDALQVAPEIAERAGNALAEDDTAPVGYSDGGQLIQASLPSEPVSAGQSLERIDDTPVAAAEGSGLQDIPVPTLENPESMLGAPVSSQTLAVIALADSAVTEDPAEAEATSADQNLMYVTGTRVNVRSGPSTNYGVIGSVSLGDEVELVALEGSSWARIRLGDGRTGFMAKRFLSRDSAGG